MPDQKVVSGKGEVSDSLVVKSDAGALRVVIGCLPERDRRLAGAYFRKRVPQAQREQPFTFF